MELEEEPSWSSKRAVTADLGQSSDLRFQSGGGRPHLPTHLGPNPSEKAPGAVGTRGLEVVTVQCSAPHNALLPMTLKVFQGLPREPRIRQETGLHRVRSHTLRRSQGGGRSTQADEELYYTPHTVPGTGAGLHTV